MIEKRKQLEAEGKDLSALDEQIGISSLQLSQEWLEKCKDLTQKYNLDAPIIQPEENFQSLTRKLDKKLFLLVRQRFPDAPNDEYVSPWTLPQFLNADGDSLRQVTT